MTHCAWNPGLRDTLSNHSRLFLSPKWVLEWSRPQDLKLHINIPIQQNKLVVSLTCSCAHLTTHYQNHGPMRTQKILNPRKSQLLFKLSYTYLRTNWLCARELSKSMGFKSGMTFFYTKFAQKFVKEKIIYFNIQLSWSKAPQFDWILEQKYDSKENSSVCWPLGALPLKLHREYVHSLLSFRVYVLKN